MSEKTEFVAGTNELSADSADLCDWTLILEIDLGSLLERAVRMRCKV